MAKKVKKPQHDFVEGDLVFDPISKREGEVREIMRNGDIKVSWHQGISSESVMMPFELELR